MERVPLSFAVFYTAAISLNTTFSVPDSVNILFTGRRLSDDENDISPNMASLYVNGHREIRGDIQNKLRELDIETAKERLRDVRIKIQQKHIIVFIT